MSRAISLIALMLLLPACGALPRDADGTTDRIERSRTMRVAVLPKTPDAGPALTLLQGYAAQHGARLAHFTLHGEHALHELEEGRIDIVVGHFAKNSPWRADVSLSKPIAQGEPGDGRRPVLRLARRNGENALILATDRAISGPPE